MHIPKPDGASWPAQPGVRIRIYTRYSSLDPKCKEASQRPPKAAKDQNCSELRPCSGIRVIRHKVQGLAGSRGLLKPQTHMAKNIWRRTGTQTATAPKNTNTPKKSGIASGDDGKCKVFVVDIYLSLDNRHKRSCITGMPSDLRSLAAAIRHQSAHRTARWNRK